MGDGVCVVEWADKASELFPEDSCWIDLDYGAGENCRSISLNIDSDSAKHARYGPLIQHLMAAFDLGDDAKSQPDEQVGN